MDDKRLRRAGCTSMSQSNQEETELRRGPWTVDEDFTLMNYIASHGEGRWNTLSRCAGLKRNGKSCRLRWLNYLRPDVRRGNISLEEQLLIIELHSRWGNRWSKIAQHLPGRTDNEIKNYWRTRVQKHAKQLKCDVNSKQFKDTMRCLWMPRLVERIQAAAAASATDAGPATATHDHNLFNNESINLNMIDHSIMNPVDNNNLEFQTGSHMVFPGPVLGNGTAHDLTSSETSAHVTTSSYNLENSSTAGSSESFGNHVSPVSDFPDHHNHHYNYYNTIPIHDSTINHPADTDFFHAAGHDFMGSSFNQGPDQFQTMNDNYLFDGGDASASLWDVDDIFLLQQQFNNTSV